jgi:hypothetical protein
LCCCGQNQKVAQRCGRYSFVVVGGWGIWPLIN